MVVKAVQQNSKGKYNLGGLSPTEDSGAKS